METYSLIQRSMGLTTAHAWLNFAETEFSLLNPIEEDYSAAFTLVGRYPDQGISLFDAVLAVLAHRFTLPVWAFDDHFEMMQTPVWRKA